MGKLHTLRRAIERDPEAWCWINIWGERWARYAKSPNRWTKNQWEPGQGLRHSGPYAAFVCHVLRKLGYDINA